MSESSSNPLPELMSLLAHDLRNPLSALLTNIHFVKSITKDRGPEVDEALSDSALSCNILGHLISNLDIIGRSFLPALPTRPMSARQAASEAAGRVAAQATLLGVGIDITPDSPGPTVLVDPGFFGRALDNLIANALQYSPAKGKVTIDFESRKDRGAVLVTDLGPSVPNEFRKLVLTGPGQVVAKQRHEARYGRGLGLYCAAEAARIAGAEIIVGERDGRSVLELTAPLAP